LKGDVWLGGVSSRSWVEVIVAVEEDVGSRNSCDEVVWNIWLA
jgi:hypothetical protein